MEVMPSWRVAYAVTIKRADRCEAGAVGPMTRMTTITLAAAAAVTPETMVGANGAMATMGGKDLELRGGLDSSPGPSAYSLRDPRPSTSSSLSFLIRTMGTISPPHGVAGTRTMHVTFSAQNLALDAQWPPRRRVTTALVTRAQ